MCSVVEQLSCMCEVLRLIPCTTPKCVDIIVYLGNVFNDPVPEITLESTSPNTACYAYSLGHAVPATLAPSQFWAALATPTPRPFPYYSFYLTGSPPPPLITGIPPSQVFVHVPYSQ